jgi:hypothetical protein
MALAARAADRLADDLKGDTFTQFHPRAHAVSAVRDN